MYKLLAKRLLPSAGHAGIQYIASARFAGEGQTPRRYNPDVVARKNRGWILLLAAGVSLLFIVNLCDALFQCGCRSWWNGGARYCNIHQPDTPYCPWCSFGWWGFVVPIGTIFLAQTGIAFAPGKLSWRNRLLLSLLSFPVVGALVGLVFAWVTRYPVFLFLWLS